MAEAKPAYKATPGPPSPPQGAAARRWSLTQQGSSRSTTSRVAPAAPTRAGSTVSTAALTETHVTEVDLPHRPGKPKSSQRPPAPAAARAPGQVGTGWCLQRFGFVGRFSVGKLHVFDEYQRRQSPWWVLAKLLVAPLPGVCCVGLLLLLPLEAPEVGITHSPMALTRSFLGNALAHLGVFLGMKQALELDDRIYSFRHATTLTIAITAVNELLWLGLTCLAGRYPIPYREPMSIATWFGWSTLVHAGLHWHVPRIQESRLGRFVPVFTLQFLVFVAFVVLAMKFSGFSPRDQALGLVLVLPCKLVLKRMIWYLGRELEDLSTDVTVCVVELTAAIFHSLILQEGAWPLTPVLVALMDAAQLAIELWLYLDASLLIKGQTALAMAINLTTHARALERPEPSPPTPPTTTAASTMKLRRPASTATVVPRASAHLKRASSTLSVQSPEWTSAGIAAKHGGRRSVPSIRYQTASSPGDEPHGTTVDGPPLQPNISTRSRGSQSLGSTSAAATRRSSEDNTKNFIDFSSAMTTKPTSTDNDTTGPSTISIDGLTLYQNADARALLQLLRLLFASEMLLFVEFLELFVALTYMSTVCLAWWLPGGRYLRPWMGYDDEAFGRLLLRSASHVFLELLSMTVIVVVVYVKCGRTGLYQIGFVLENYWMTIYGKVTGMTLVLVNHATLQQGVDMRFLFAQKPS